MLNHKIIDIHSHIIPAVDDGSSSLEMSISMLEKMVMDGVSDVFATPHIQSSVTKTTREAQIEAFELLKKQASHLPINIHLGAEIRYRSHLTTDYPRFTLGNTKYVLIEFNPHEEEPIEDVLYNVQKNGYQVILAHCERYQYLTIKDYQSLKNNGILLQVNADATMDLTTKHEFKIIKKLLSLKLVDFVATDTHNHHRRPPNLRDAYQYLSKKIDGDYLELIFYKNAEKIIKEQIK